MRLIALAAAVAASLIAPQAILAEEQTAGQEPLPAIGAGGVEAPGPGDVASNELPGDPDQPLSDPDRPTSGPEPSDPAQPSVQGDGSIGIEDAVEVDETRASGNVKTSARRKGAASASAVAAADVTIGDFFYEPKKVTINTGETVKWVNDGEAAEGHTVTSDTFDSGVMKTGKTYSRKFTEEGTFDYFCALHPQMTGSVVVAAASAGGGDSGGTTGPTPPTDTGGSSGSLPITGQDLILLVIVGLDVLLAGVFLSLRTRRTS